MSLDEIVVKRTREAAQRQGLSLSAWLNEAAKDALDCEAGLAVIEEVEREIGEPSPEVVAWADRALAPVWARREVTRKKLGI